MDKLNICGKYKTNVDYLKSYNAWKKAGSNKISAKTVYTLQFVVTTNGWGT